MTQPLALLIYENLLPGSQLVNRLRDLGYRVHTGFGAGELLPLVREQKPLVVLAEVASPTGTVMTAIRALRSAPDTRHVPIIAFSGSTAEDVQSLARDAGATLVVASDGMLEQLPLLLSQALEVD
jgi:two-component system, cell cycle response regulator DivK